MASSEFKLQPARELANVYRTLQPTPLTTIEELEAFYVSDINAVRGGDKVKRLQLRLQRAYNDRIPFKACVMGHRGVGKSTEISRLLARISSQFEAIRFSATQVLDPGSFRPLDVLLVMMIELAEATAKPVQKGGADYRPSKARLQEIWDWFSTEKETRQLAEEAALTVEAGAGVEDDSLWNKVLGLFATLKGEIKFASARAKEVVTYRLTRLDLLIEVTNRLLDECNDAMRRATGKQWLFVGEDFDKAGIPSTQIEDLFINYANIFQGLRTSLIFTLPIGLYYSAKATRLPFEGFVIPDTPMFDISHAPNQTGQAAVEKVLTARMNPALFEPDELSRLIVASGGNLRDLFSLINEAADGAFLREALKIAREDTNAAIVKLRSDYERRLGQSPYDPETISYQDKAELLVRIYNGEKVAQITSPALYSLLNSRAVQEFNGQRWFGLHPLVVDILIAQNYLQTGAAGGTS